MKPMRYIILLNIIVNSISMYAGRSAAGENSQRPGLTFPTSRLHRYLNRSERVKVIAARRAEIKRQIELYREQTEKREKAEEKAQEIVTKLYEQIDKQVDEKAAEIRAAIDPSTLETLDLEALD